MWRRKKKRGKRALGERYKVSRKAARGIPLRKYEQHTDRHSVKQTTYNKHRTNLKQSPDKQTHKQSRREGEVCMCLLQQVAGLGTKLPLNVGGIAQPCGLGNDLARGAAQRCAVTLLAKRSAGSVGMQMRLFSGQRKLLLGLLGFVLRELGQVFGVLFLFLLCDDLWCVNEFVIVNLLVQRISPVHLAVLAPPRRSGTGLALPCRCLRNVLLLFGNLSLTRLGFELALLGGLALKLLVQGVAGIALLLATKTAARVQLHGNNVCLSAVLALQVSLFVTLGVGGALAKLEKLVGLVGAVALGPRGLLLLLLGLDQRLLLAQKLGTGGIAALRRRGAGVERAVAARVGPRSTRAGLAKGIVGIGGDGGLGGRQTARALSDGGTRAGFAEKVDNGGLLGVGAGRRFLDNLAAGVALGDTHAAAPRCVVIALGLGLCCLLLLLCTLFLLLLLERLGIVGAALAVGVLLVVLDAGRGVLRALDKGTILDRLPLRCTLLGGNARTLAGLGIQRRLVVGGAVLGAVAAARVDAKVAAIDVGHLRVAVNRVGSLDLARVGAHRRACSLLAHDLPHVRISGGIGSSAILTVLAHQRLALRRRGILAPRVVRAEHLQVLALLLVGAEQLLGL
eukprot:m.14012 g.14012  ORF g.14012 m.14012 type:complete len:622 (-) comp6320_c0_seq2:496-2361(-)